MTATEIRQKYLDFFVARNHAIIPPAPLVPLNDPTTLFTSSGMQQLVPYLKGEPHPMGTRLVDSQPCFRSEDILEVGDNRHTTFFEMLGNWSLGDYFKEDQLGWFWTFLTQVLKLPKDRLWVSVFNGDHDFQVIEADGQYHSLARDDESQDRWLKLGIPENHLHFYDAQKNWWSRAGTPANMPVGEIGGPDSEVFFEFQEVEHNPEFGPTCHPNCDCGRFLEIGNSVFMQYQKVDEKTFKPLPKRNVDFGGGLERLTAASQNDPDVFNTDLFLPIVDKIAALSGKNYHTDEISRPAIRTIADHIKAAVFMIHAGIEPSNKTQGYFLRRYLRRATVKIRNISADNSTLSIVENLKALSIEVVKIYRHSHFTEDKVQQKINIVIETEIGKFIKTLEKGLKKIDTTPIETIDTQFAFNLFQSEGFPFEVTQELVVKRGKSLDSQKYNELYLKHQENSRSSAQGLFKGGLADHSETIVKYHTATHLLHQALRDVLGNHVQQMGSNITHERLRFDFKHPEKLSDEQKSAIENLINQKIKEDLPVHKTVEPQTAALASGALAFFREQYPDTVSVYTIGVNPDHDWFSKELCGGPHVTSTGQIGSVTIKKEESVGAGVRRIYLTLAG